MVSVSSAVASMLSTFVHCLTSSAMFIGTTVLSDEPCHSWIFGHGPVKPLSPIRARSPHCCAVFDVPGLWQEYAPATDVAQRYGSPELIDTAANRSGHVARITAANAPPAEKPAM